ncbi:MAG: nitric oxide reductase [Ignavibacteriae bacterium]|nr:nitric oxide reductase [Ignavibacteriota bacterium]
MEATTSTEKINYKNIFYPPGGILIWMIILVEVLTFTIALIVFAFQRQDTLNLFNTSQAMLDKIIGTINTIVLLTSGFFMAESLHKLKLGNNVKSKLYLLVTIFFGIVFLALKSYEYGSKLNHGIGLNYNSFFTFYWLLTGFHFLHVLFGVILLTYIYKKIKSGKYSQNNFLDVETSASFWHMCDLIWMLLFPVLYLLN